MGSTGSGGRALAWFNVQSQASGYPATEHARREPSSGDSVARQSCCYYLGPGVSPCTHTQVPGFSSVADPPCQLSGKSGPAQL